MCTNLARILFIASTMTFGLTQAAQAGAWSEVFIPSNGSAQHASKSACRQGAFDPYTDGARMGPRDPYSDGGGRIGPRDPYADGARNVGSAGECALRAA